MTLSDSAHDLLVHLRPQSYGLARPNAIENPIVEPMWAGVRVLVAVDDRRVSIRDEEGEPVEDRPEIANAIGPAIHAESAVLDGFLTKEAVRTGGELIIDADMPTSGQIVNKFFFGIRRDHAREAEQERERLREAATFREDELVAFVATDLLHLDGESLLDVPLLERKRLLGSTVEEAELVRLGAFVRPPIETWVTSWRRLGFVELSYRAANSRYHPGQQRDEWTRARMHRR